MPRGDLTAPDGETGDVIDSSTRFDRVAAIIVLTLFALTWPVLDLLGRNAEFFLARRSPKTEILYLALIATILIPALIGLLGALPGRPGHFVALSCIGVLATALVFLYARRLPVTWWIAAVLSVGAGYLITLAFIRFGPFRSAGRYLVVAPAATLAVFLFTMPVGDVLREPDSKLGNPVSVANPVPVVMVVFDELPLASIIDPEGSLRSQRYPNFGRLADDAVWYRNATTVEQQTEHSLPAILTGSRADYSSIPVAGHYPFNLFTALRDRYDLHVYESITQLCPRALCEGLTSSVSSLAEDVGVIAGHVLLPEPMSRGLPPIDRGWGDFDAAADDFDARERFRAELEQGPRVSIDRLLADIRSSDHQRPELFYLHPLIPHHPWQYLPDGRSYPYVIEANPASVEGGWTDDEFLVAQSMQRHLLQVGYADHILGEVIAALEEEGIYDEALMVVMADHGIAIRPGVEHQRKITEDTVGDIAAIPLFVKPPNAKGGAIDDRRALTIDVLPTVADVLNADLPDDVEGVSLLGPDPQRSETTTRGPLSSVTFGVDGAEKLVVASLIESLFPDGDPWALRPPGGTVTIGSRVSDDLAVSALRARLLDGALYEEVDTMAPVIPVRIGGTLSGDVDGTEVLAVAVNGTVATLTRSYEVDGQGSFLAMVPPEHFVDGENDIEVFEVTTGGDLLTVVMSGV